MKTRHSLAIALFAVPLLACAAADDEEIRFEESVRNFGFTSGAALQCASASEKSGIEAQSLKAYSGLVRLFGSDHAFFYASAFGAGAVMPVDKVKCPEYKASFEKSMKSQSAK